MFHGIPHVTDPNRQHPAIPAALQASGLRRMDADMQRALTAGHISLAYQPRSCLRTGQSVGWEAQPRWEDPVRGTVLSSAFMRVAEASPTPAIGAWMLEQACQDVASWPATQVLVPVLARQVLSGLLAAQVEAALEQSGLQPERLDVQIPVTLAGTDSIEALLSLSALRDLGVGVVLGGFGPGLSNAAQRLPLTGVRLQRPLIRGLPGNTAQAAAVQASIGAARELGLAVIAAGIETEEQRAFLSGTLCQDGTGTLFGTPVQADAAGSAAMRRGKACGRVRSASASGHDPAALPAPP